MNILASEQPTTLEEMKAAYKARRARMEAAPVVPDTEAAPPAPTPAPLPSPAPPAWVRSSILRERVKPPRYRKIITEAATAHDLYPDDMFTDSHDRKAFLARADAMSRLNEAGVSKLKIGRFFRRDHATVLSAIKRHKGVFGPYKPNLGRRPRG